MTLEELPFSRLIGIEYSDSDQRLRLPFSDQVKNHLGIFHAGAQFALMETASGLFLQQRFPEWEEKVIPVLRKAEVKYMKPASSDLTAEAYAEEKSLTAFEEQMDKAGRCLVSVSVDSKNETGDIVSRAVFQWLITRR